MFIQKGILEYKKEAESLFLRKSDNKVCFNTFYNSLNLFLVKKYLKGLRVKLVIHVDGEHNINICYSNRKETKDLSFDKLNDSEYIFDISNLPEYGMVYPVVEGGNIVDFRYEVECPSRDISMCVLMTTYNRQEFLIPNLEKLDKCKGIAHVIVVDNGRNVTLPKHLSKDKFTVIPNKNLGGTGGFTRGMMEAKKRGYSHVFLMDDDITLIPEVTEKAVSLMSSLTEEHKNDWLGFSMLLADNPTIQHELGARYNGYKLHSDRNRDLSKLSDLYDNQINKKYDYSAWWSLIMPTSVIDKYGYPFPMFIKFDDIEYPLRRRGEEIILTNGFGVWHESFESKFSAYLEYYICRNSFVTSALHVKHFVLKTFCRTLLKYGKFYLFGRRNEMEFLKLAINDFLKGPDFFLSLDMEKKNQEIREFGKHKVNIFKHIFVSPFVAAYNLFKILFRFGKAKKVYNARVNELTSESYWEGVFNHE